MNNKSANRSIGAVSIKHKRAKKSKSVEAKQDIKKVGKGLFFAIVLVLIVPIVVLAGPIIKEQRASRERQKIVLPSPTVNPSLLPSSQPKTNPVNPNTNSNLDYMVNCRTTAECGSGTVYIKKSECDNSICCQIGDKWIFYKDKNKCSVDQNRNNQTFTQPTFVNPGNQEIKINCSFSSEKYSFDFGMITYNKCTIKSNEYWNQQKQNIQTNTQININPSPITVINKSQAEIDKCKSEIKSKYNDLIQGCSILYGATSAERQCQIAYGEQMNNAIAKCY